jgi:hypothetical protein
VKIYKRQNSLEEIYLRIVIQIPHNNCREKDEKKEKKQSKPKKKIKEKNAKAIDKNDKISERKDVRP